MVENNLKDKKAINGDRAFRANSAYGTEIENTFAGALSFMRRKYSRDLNNVDIAVTGIPFDLATSNRPGARFGPQAIRKASVNFAWGPIWPWGIDPFDSLSVIDYGDCYFDFAKAEKIIDSIIDHASGIIKPGVSLVSLGGDHFISYPLLKAHYDKHGPLALIHFDAHRDVEETSGNRLDHGSMFRRAIDEGIIIGDKTVQIGIRTQFNNEEKYGMEIIHADFIHEYGINSVIEKVKSQVGEHKAYLTFDIDCLDPAFAPGTGTPVPGGLTSAQALSIIRELSNINFIGMDIVEVSPAYDHAEITSLVAAQIVVEYICLLASKR